MAEFFDLKAFNPEAFHSYVDEMPKTRRNELIRSRAIRYEQRINDVFSSQTGSYYATIPLFGRIGGTALNYDGQTDITSNNTGTFTQGITVVGRSNAWTEKSFSTDITSGVDFMSNVARQVSGYWEDIDQDTMISVLKGLFSMTGAGNTDFVTNHTYDISAASNPLMDATTLNTAIQRASGDKKSKYSLVIMPSIVATNLENLNLIQYLKYTDEYGVQRDLSMGTWNGKTVLVDDGMPVDTSGIDPIYTVYTLGDGAFAYADIGTEYPYEMSRDPAKNGGETTLYSRQRKVFSPYGMSFTKKSVASLSPVDTELSNGANWELVNNGQAGAKRETIAHKEIPIARILCKG